MQRTRVGVSFVVVGLFTVLAAGRVSAQSAVSVPAPKCPQYESLMRSAAQSLRAGDRAAAIAKLHEARTALDTCESKLSTARLLG